MWHNVQSAPAFRKEISISLVKDLEKEGAPSWEWRERLKLNSLNSQATSMDRSFYREICTKIPNSPAGKFPSRPLFSTLPYFLSFPLCWREGKYCDIPLHSKTDQKHSGKTFFPSEFADWSKSKGFSTGNLPGFLPAHLPSFSAAHFMDCPAARIPFPFTENSETFDFHSKLEWNQIIEIFGGMGLPFSIQLYSALYEHWF